MNWIQKNLFLFALSGITLLGVAGLFYYGNQGGSRYETAKTEFDQAMAEASSMEKTIPYPTDTNRDGKKKAIDDFKKEVEALQEAFAPYRPGELEMVSPEQFMDRLKEVNRETREQFELNAVTVPETFYAGFKDYTGRFPSRSATGILGYQLEAIRGLLMAVAKSGATEVRNLHRPSLEEESGTIFQPAEGMVVRSLPVEITFKGPERALRKFVSALAQNDKHYWVVRSLRIGNIKKDPPKTADAKFNVPAARVREAAAFDIFSFDNPGDDGAAAAPEGGATEPAPEEAAADPAPADAPAGAGNRILALILGNEELIVHVRLDLMMFLEPTPLP